MRLAPVLAVAALAALPLGGTSHANGCVTGWAQGEHPGPPSLVTVDEHDGMRVETNKAQSYATYVVWDVAQLVRCVV